MTFQHDIMAMAIVERIISDIQDRSELGDKWDMIDDDTKEDISERWTMIVIKELEDQ